MQPTYPYIFVRGKNMRISTKKWTHAYEIYLLRQRKNVLTHCIIPLKKGHYTHIIIVDIKEMYEQKKNPKCI